MKAPTLITGIVLGLVLPGCTPSNPPLALESCGVPKVLDSAASGIYSTVYHCNLSRERVFVKATTDAQGNVTPSIQSQTGDVIEICQVVSVIKQSNGFNFTYNFKNVGFNVKPVNITGYKGQSVRVIEENGNIYYRQTFDSSIQSKSTDATIFICNTTYV